MAGGQDKEDQKREEIMFHEVLAKDQITNLLAPKVFTKAVRYTGVGDTDLTGKLVPGTIKVQEEPAQEFHDDDNLIIKGNNLIALSSLLERYEGRVKLIYIDPPYNTGTDSFCYNDRFDRSTWLSFMKSRLEIARRLLSVDGVILIQCSFHQYPYLRVLSDEIFTDRCHQFDMNTLVRHPDRSLTGDKKFNDVIEYTLIYSKTPTYEMPKRIIEKTLEDYEYDFQFLGSPNETITFGGKNVSVYTPDRVIKSRSIGHVNGLKSMSIRGSIREKNSSGRFYVSYLEPLVGKYPKGTVFTVPNLGDDGREFRIFELPQGTNKNGVYYPGQPLSSDVTLKPYANFVDFVKEYNNVNDEGDVSFRNGKKPESYIQFYMEIFSAPDQLVLDFYLGSGTTAAVAHKMNRHYIGVEQMDYIQTITAPRLKKVIEGEQGGISKAVHWQGGGSFVYCELLEDAARRIREIEAATEQTIDQLKDAIYQDERIVPYLTAEELKAADEGFEELSLEDKKRVLITLIDKNKLYVNASSMDDEEYKISAEDKAFTKSFYEGGRA